VGNADASLIFFFFFFFEGMDASLMGREKRRWFTGPTFAFLLLSAYI
jgi:hypothetical protein